MNNTEEKREHYYFTWGTLKKGFANHDEKKYILGDLIGKYSTVEPLSLIVPVDPFCPNPNCRYVHRIGALTEANSEYCKRLKGELYKVTTCGLQKLDKLEGYNPEDLAKSEYIRKEIDLEEEGTGKVVRAFIYFIANPEPYEALLSTGQAEIVPEYTLDMSKGDYKDCCKADFNHTGEHDSLPFPDLITANG